MFKLNDFVLTYILLEHPEEAPFLEEADPHFTFADLWETLDAHGDVYSALGINDSVDREYAFDGLVEALTSAGYQVTYDDVYLTWLGRRESVIE